MRSTSCRIIRTSRENMDRFALLNRYHVTLLAYLLEKLAGHAGR